MFKIAVAITSITGAVVLSVAGFKEGVTPDADVQYNLRYLFIGLQCGGTALAMLAIVFFPISPQRAQDNERLIADRLASEQNDTAEQEQPTPSAEPALVG